MKYLFFRLQCGQDNCAEALSSQKRVETKYTVRLWRPAFTELTPTDMSILPFGVWWLFHHLGVFTNRDYCVLVIYDDSLLIHRSCVFPRYFRFPFMNKDDLQIGDTWTDLNYRGQGLATYAIHQIIELCKKSRRYLWYVVEQDNIPSIRVIEKAGFTRVGEGTRSERFGLSILGAYTMHRQS